MPLCRACTSAEDGEELQMALKIERFQPEGMNVRMSAGQPSYSHVVTVSGTGKLVFTAGQLARDIDGIASAKVTCGHRWNRRFRIWIGASRPPVPRGLTW